MISTLPRHVAHSAYLSERRSLPSIAKFLIEAAYWFTQRTEKAERRMLADQLSDHMAKDVGITTVRYNRYDVMAMPFQIL